MDNSKGWGINETANLLHYNDVILWEKFQDAFILKDLKFCL